MAGLTTRIYAGVVIVDSIDDLRSELQRFGEAWIEPLRAEFQALGRRIGDIKIELLQSSRKKFRRRPDPRKQAIARLIQNTPEITTLQICREMDKLREKSADYTPPRSWNCQFWWEAYRRLTNRVHSYISSVRHSLR